jgi:hypothetical protein
VAAAKRAGSGAMGPRCLLRGGKAGAAASFEALVAQAKEIDEPLQDLDPVMAIEHGPEPNFDRGPRVFASWGEMAGGGLLDLVALSPVPHSAQRGVSLAIVLTDKGRFAALIGQGFFSPLPASDEERLVRDILPKAASIVVTAERAVPIARVRELLDLLAPAAGAVVLATHRGKAAPPRSNPPSRYEARVKETEPFGCDATMKRGNQGRTIGDWGTSQLNAASKRFDEAIAPCIQGSAADGRIHVMMLVKPDGTLESACAETDDTGDAAARKCVVEAARKLALPVPEEQGFVGFGSQAVFPGRAVRATCD